MGALTVIVVQGNPYNEFEYLWQITSGFKTALRQAVWVHHSEQHWHQKNAVAYSVGQASNGCHAITWVHDTMAAVPMYCAADHWIQSDRLTLHTRVARWVPTYLLT